MMVRILGGAWSATSRYRLVLLLVVAMFAAFAITQPEFATATNLKNLLADSSILWIVGMGMTFVLLTGGFDLSVGATSALTGIFVAKVLATGMPGGVALLLAVLFGALIGGLLNGFAVGRLGLSVFVVTLATMTALTGIVNLWAGTDSFLVTAPIVSQLGVDELLGLPTPIWVMAAVFVVALYVQSRTYFGRDVFAIGGSATAARLAGIRVPRTLMLVYAFVGACAALAGVIAVGRVGAATPTVDATLALQAIAAVLLGGTALTGGAGGVTGTAFGVLFIGILQNGLGLAGVSSDWQNVVTGVILVLAVMGDRLRFGGSLRSMLPGRRSLTGPAELS
ncbi:MAG: hypothetical protein JWP17_2559 [Solirubrobacterales bacterium]|jgi:ribose transport system permease protein|nr:hypothetical protein [Solirubrobacterales bacterium]